MAENKVIIYTANDGTTKIDVKLEEETLWLTQAQMCELYQTSKSNVSEHIKHIFEEGELIKEATVRKFRTVQQEGSRSVEREVEHYNLDMIIALGYRVRSLIATRFRQWATERLLQDNGSVSHEEAMEHATTEYRKYKQRTISDVERDYLFSIKTLEDLSKKKN